MYGAQPNPIIEYTHGMAVDDLTASIPPLATCVGLLVTEGTEPIDCRMILERLPVPCHAIAFVTDKSLRRKQRIVSGVALTQQHGCLCRVFASPEEARMWLQVQMASNLL